MNGLGFCVTFPLERFSILRDCVGRRLRLNFFSSSFLFVLLLLLKLLLLKGEQIWTEIGEVCELENTAFNTTLTTLTLHFNWHLFLHTDCRALHQYYSALVPNWAEYKDCNVKIYARNLCITPNLFSYP